MSQKDVMANEFVKIFNNKREICPNWIKSSYEKVLYKKDVVSIRVQILQSVIFTANFTGEHLDDDVLKEQVVGVLIIYGKVASNDNLISK